MIEDYSIELLDPKKHKKESFKCGVHALDTYLKEKANQEQQKRFTTVYVLTHKDSEDILGFYTLSGNALKLNELPQDQAKKLPKYDNVPAIVIGRLALDKKIQGKGFGKYLLLNALKRSVIISKELGIYLVFVDAKDKEAKNFYEKFGFVTLIENKQKLFITIKQLDKLFNP